MKWDGWDWEGLELPDRHTRSHPPVRSSLEHVVLLISGSQSLYQGPRRLSAHLFSLQFHPCAAPHRIYTHRAFTYPPLTRPPHQLSTPPFPSRPAAHHGLRNMVNRSLPFYLEDRTGQYTGSDFDEIYDRLFLRIARPPPSQVAHFPETTLMVYNTGRRSSSQRHSRPPQREPAVVLEFGPNSALGTITFAATGLSMPMTQYLRKTSMFAG